jgi:carboxypeptidase C (cathepsin A)
LQVCQNNSDVIRLLAVDDFSVLGESYAGHYLPAWANAILNYNEDSANVNKLNFAGMIIGNGEIDTTIQNTDTFVQFQHASNLIPSTSQPKNQAAANSAMDSYIGYTPNYYDYR